MRVVKQTTALLLVLCPTVGACSSDSAAPVPGPADSAVESSIPESGVEAAAQDTASGADAAVDAPVADTPVADARPTFALDIFVIGSTTPVAHEDGFVGQTPSNFVVGVSRVELRTSATDPSPVKVLDFGDSYVQVDLLSKTLLGTADLTKIAPALYSHGAVELAYASLDLQVTAHPTLPPLPIAGTATVLTALSDTTIDGVPRNQGWAQYTFHLLTGLTKETTLPSLPSTEAGTIVQQGGKTYLVFPLAPVLTVVPIPTQSRSVEVTFQVHESFRWEDQNQSGYAEKVFDVTEKGETEPVKNVGATDYKILVQ